MNTIPFDQIRVFNMGKQVPIYVYDLNGNNKWETTDYIELVGHKADGKFDTELYTSAAFQRHTFQSIISDKNSYYITYRTTGSPDRYSIANNYPDPGSAPVLNHKAQSIRYGEDYYYMGPSIIISTSEAFLSDYTEGEGFYGPQLSSPQDSTNPMSPLIQVPARHYDPAGFNPDITIGVVSTMAYYDIDDHWLIYKASPNGSIERRLGDTIFGKNIPVTKTMTLKSSDFGPSGTNIILYNGRLPNLPPNYSPGYAFSHFILNYPKSYHLDDSTNYRYSESASALARNIEWQNYGSGAESSPIIFDEVNKIRINGTYNGGTKKVTYVLPPLAQEGRICIEDASKMASLGPADCHLVKWPNYNNHPDSTQYIIITDSALLSPKNEIGEYKKTWENYFSAVRVIYDDPLFDAFSYGIEHPLAIRHYCKFLLDNSTTMKPKYMLMLGRGFDMLYNRGYYRNQVKAEWYRNFVPVMGNPASDNMFTAGLDGTKLEPAIPTGRISVDSAGQIMDYVLKLRKYLDPDNQYRDWQKNVLHLAGGATGDQAAGINNKMANLQKYVLQNPFAGRVVQYSRSSVDPVDPKIKLNTLELINKGVNLMTFLGHGSSQVIDIDIGNPGEWNNPDRYPICYFNGCQVGNPTTAVPPSTYLLAEAIMKAKNKGGIAFLGQTYISELYTVLGQMDFFYRNYFDGNSKRLGDVLKSCIRDFQQPFSPLNRTHCQQLFLQGDPALPVYLPKLPDFSISNSSLFIDPPNVIALSDSFRVGVIVTNLGRGVDSSFYINLERLYDATNKRNYSIRVRQNKFVDTFYFTIFSKDTKTKGDNTFTVDVNLDHQPDEYTFQNNHGFFKFEMPGNGVNLVYPPKFGVVGSDTVSLTVQPADLFKELEDFFIEIDTTPSFSSPALQSLARPTPMPITAGIITKWKVNLAPAHDSQAYFWRARISTNNTDGAWTEGTFTYVKDHAEAWMQNNAWQLTEPASKDIFEHMAVDTNTRVLSYIKLVKGIFIDADVGMSGKGIKEQGYEAQTLTVGGSCNSNNLVVMLWDSRKLEPIPIDSNIMFPKCDLGKKWTYFQNSIDYQLFYSFAMSDTNEQNQFVKFVNAVPDSTYVTVLSSGWSYAAKWKPDVFDALHTFGSTIFDSVGLRTDDAMWLCIGKKGWTSGSEETIGINTYTAINHLIVGEAYEGKIFSESLGPTNKFKKLYFTVIKKDKDSFSVDVLGLKTGGGSDVLIKRATKSPVDLTGIDTKQYKFLKLIGNFYDRDKHTPPNMTNWRVTMDPVPDGSLYPDKTLGYLFKSDTLYEGDTMRFHVPFRNISTVPFRDSLLLTYNIMNKITRDEITSGSMKFAALQPDSFFLFKTQLVTKGLSGSYAVTVSVNPDFLQPERTLSNNSNTISFVVEKDVINPLLDVTFDGRHIVDGEIVSANPFILISSKDENKFLWQKDTNNMEIFLQKGATGSFVQVPFGTDAIYFPATSNENRARVEYRPVNLATGTYILKVQSKDASNNLAGKVEYLIGFQVDQNQTITQFYPYPNPFTSKMRFVFTLTGSTVPEEIRIKIMNTEGRTVKEVSKSDLGDIHVGNNITDWSWDGTDQFGDKLGNGTYFYSVVVRENGEDVKLRATKGDRSFKEQTGVIYLMR